MLRCAAPARAHAAATPSPAERGGSHAAPHAAKPAQPLGRRHALAAAAAAAALTGAAAPQSARADEDESVVVVPGIKGERWNAVDATLTLPPGYARRAGSRAKTTKTLLYTDTYGPSYRYSTLLPRFVNADGGYACESLALQIEGRSGTEAITDLGPQSGVDPARAFELTAQIDDIVLAEIVTAATRTDKGGQSYFDWELTTPGGHHVLLTAVASGGGLAVLSLDATAEQFAANAKALRALQSSFTLARSDETTLDASQRIYATRKAGGFK